MSSEQGRLTALRARDVRKTYATPAGAVAAVRDLTVDIEWGEFVGIMGPSGSGKSTALGLLAGLVTPDPDSSSVVVAGQAWNDLNPGAQALLRRNECAVVHQGVNLVDFMTVAENVAFPLLMRGTSREQARAAAADALRQFDLEATADRLPAHISGGQQQRVAIARAAAASQRILLADEPTGSLDSKNAVLVFRTIRDHVDRGGVAVVVSHNDVVEDFADRVLTIKDGAIAS